MDTTTLAQEVDLVLHAPVVTIIGVVVLGGAIWKLVNWAYGLRIDGLNDRYDAQGERLKLANERLENSNQELTKVKSELESINSQRRRDEEAGSKFWDALQNASFQLGNTVLANTSTLSVSGNIQSGVIRKIELPPDALKQTDDRHQ